MVKPLRLLLLGAPGSGKGTQTSRLLRQFPHIQSLSSGDTLRAQIAGGTAVGVQADKFIKEGQLIPDKTMVELVTNQLRDLEWLAAQKSWLLDGFPRTVDQAEQLQPILDEADASLNLVVELDVDQAVIRERISARWTHVPSGRVYNLEYNPPKTPYTDDETGEPLTRRDDDTPEVFQKRLDEYNRLVGPLKDFYRQQGILHAVSGDTSDVIFPKLAALVDDKLR